MSSDASKIVKIVPVSSVPSNAGSPRASDGIDRTQVESLKLLSIDDENDNNNISNININIKNKKDNKLPRIIDENNETSYDDIGNLPADNYLLLPTKHSPRSMISETVTIGTMDVGVFNDDNDGVEYQNTRSYIDDNNKNNDDDELDAVVTPPAQTNIITNDNNTGDLNTKLTKKIKKPRDRSETIETANSSVSSYMNNNNNDNNVQQTNPQKISTKISKINTKQKGNKNRINSIYKDSKKIDIDNIQFDEEVNLKDDNKNNNNNRKNNRNSNTSNDSKQPGFNRVRTRSVRFNEEENAYLSPRNDDENNDDRVEQHYAKMEEFKRQSEAMYGNIVSRNAPIRFRGPASISLLSKYVPTDPFIGDTEVLQWSVGDVEVWVRNLDGGVNVYSGAFVRNHIKGRDLLDLTENDLEDHLNIKSIGHRKLLINAINELKKCVIVEINESRFLIPPHGAVLRFNDISIQERNKNNIMTPIIAHVTGTFLPNQITAIMGTQDKHVLLNVLSGNNVNGSHIISGSLYFNGSPVNGSLVSSGLASFIDMNDDFKNFNHATVADVVKFHYELSGNNHHEFAMNDNKEILISHVLRVADVTYPHETKISKLSLLKLRRLIIAIDCILYNIKLIFLDMVLENLNNIESQEMMRMIYAFSRRLDITFVITVDKIKYTLLNTYFDQIIVVGNIDVNNNNNINMDLYTSPSSIRFSGRPEDILEYFEYNSIIFDRNENPLQIINENIKLNGNLIIDRLEQDYFKYRRKPDCFNPSTFKSGPRNNIFKEMFIITKFIWMIGWREWSIFYSILRIIIYSLIIGGLFWDVSCIRLFINERLLAIFVITCLSLSSIYPMLDFLTSHRQFWIKHVLYNRRSRITSFVFGTIMLASSHAFFVSILSFLPWKMEDLGAGTIDAFARIAIIQFVACLIAGMIALVSTEISLTYKIGILSPLVTGFILFSGAIVHPGLITRVALILVNINWMRYAFEFLLYVDVDYIHNIECGEYVKSLENRLLYDREFIDFLVLSIWFITCVIIFNSLLVYYISTKIKYASQFKINFASKTDTDDIYNISNNLQPNTLPLLTEHLNIVSNQTFNDNPNDTIQPPLNMDDISTPINASVLPVHITPLHTKKPTASSIGSTPYQAFKQGTLNKYIIVYIYNFIMCVSDDYQMIQMTAIMAMLF